MNLNLGIIIGFKIIYLGPCIFVPQVMTGGEGQGRKSWTEKKFRDRLVRFARMCPGTCGL